MLASHEACMQVEVQASMQPQLASAEVASRLEVAGACQELPSGEQLALDMSARLQRHEQCCKSLLHQGQVRTHHVLALNVILQHPNHVAPLTIRPTGAQETTDACECPNLCQAGQL